MATVGYKVIDAPWNPSECMPAQTMLNTQGSANWQLVTVYPDPLRERTRWVFQSSPGAVTYKVADYLWSPSNSSVSETMLNSLGAQGWRLIAAYVDSRREKTRWVFSNP